MALPFLKIDKLQHGTRAKYSTGCRCVPCRAANSRYESERLRARADGDHNPLVSATAAQAHLVTLSQAGIGRRRVQQLCGVTDTVLHEVKTGRKLQIRARTERLILGVGLDGTFTPPAKTEWCKPCLERREHRCPVHANGMCKPCFDGEAHCAFGRGRGAHMRQAKHRRRAARVLKAWHQRRRAAQEAAA